MLRFAMSNEHAACPWVWSSLARHATPRTLHQHMHARSEVDRLTCCMYIMHAASTEHVAGACV